MAPTMSDPTMNTKKSTKLGEHAGEAFVDFIATELICMILENLPAFDIHSFRMVNKHCNDLADTPGNLFTPMGKAAKECLEGFVKEEVSQHAPGVDMLDAVLKGIQAYAGRHPEQKARIAYYFSFLHKYRCTGKVHHHLAPIHGGTLDLRGTESLLNILFLIDLKHHPRPGNPQLVPGFMVVPIMEGDEDGDYSRYYDTPEKFAEYAQAMSDGDPGVKLAFGVHTADEWKELYYKLQHTSNGLFHGINGLIGEGDQAEPKYPLTFHTKHKGTLKAQRLMVKTFGLDLSKEQRVQAGLYDMLDLERPLDQNALRMATMFSVEEVVSTLDVPSIPSLMENSALRYALPSKRAFDLFGKVVDEGMPLTPLLKHFLLSELCIY